MPCQTLTILGIPIHNFTTKEMARHALSLMKKKKTPARYIGTVNTHFLSTAYHCSRTQPRHPELLHILRTSFLLTADGMPLVWLSRCLGFPLKERVTGIDLLQRLAEEMSQENMSMFLVGGQEKIAQTAASNLHERYPGLKIVGITCPMIFTEGENIINADERDALLIEEINEAKPDLLVLNLGHPKQEIWFERVHHKLDVSLAIGVGGSLSFLSGKIPRAPGWMQRMGLEWVYRLWQEPKRLWSRYFVALFKFTVFTVPLLVYHLISSALFRLKTRPQTEKRKNLLFISSEKTIAIIPLPSCIDQHMYERLHFCIEEALSQDVVIFDFRAVRHLDLEGISLMTNSWLKARKINKEIYALGITKKIRVFLKLHRIWDLIAPDAYPDAKNMMGHIHEDMLFYSIHQEGNHVVLSFLGHLDNQQDHAGKLRHLEPILSLKPCIIDLSYCSQIDNGGIYFLLKIQKLVQDQNQSFEIRGASKEITKQLQLANVYQILTRRS